MLESLVQESASSGDAAVDLKLSLREQQEVENALNEMAAVVNKQPVPDFDFGGDDVSKDNQALKLLVTSILSAIENGSEQEVETVLQNAITSITAKVAKDKSEAKKQAAQLDEVVAILEAVHSTKFQPVLNNAVVQCKQILTIVRNADLGVFSEALRGQQFKLSLKTPGVNENIRSLEAAKQTPKLENSQLNTRQNVLRNLQAELQQNVKANLNEAYAKTGEAYSKLTAQALKEVDPAAREKFAQASKEIFRQGNLIREAIKEITSVKPAAQEQVGSRLVGAFDLKKLPLKDLGTAQKVIQERDRHLTMAEKQHVEVQSLDRNKAQQKAPFQMGGQADLVQDQKGADAKRNNVFALRPPKTQAPYPAIEPKPNETKIPQIQVQNALPTEPPKNSLRNSVVKHESLVQPDLTAPKQVNDVVKHKEIAEHHAPVKRLPEHGLELEKYKPQKSAAAQKPPEHDPAICNKQCCRPIQAPIYKPQKSQSMNVVPEHGPGCKGKCCAPEPATRDINAVIKGVAADARFARRKVNVTEITQPAGAAPQVSKGAV